jgi:hypothetical protein
VVTDLDRFLAVSLFIFPLVSGGRGAAVSSSLTVRFLTGSRGSFQGDLLVGGQIRLCIGTIYSQTKGPEKEPLPTQNLSEAHRRTGQVLFRGNLAKEIFHYQIALAKSESPFFHSGLEWPRQNRK